MEKIMKTWNFSICFLYVFVPVFELEHLAFPVFAPLSGAKGADIVQGMLDKAEAKGCEAEKCNEMKWFHSTWNSKQPFIHGCLVISNHFPCKHFESSN